MKNFRFKSQWSLWRNLILAFVFLSLLPTQKLSEARQNIQSTYSTQIRRANIPHLEDSFDWAETAIFWFGINEQGIPSKNYADVRIAYTINALEIRVTVIDYYLWYNANPQAGDDLREYEAVAISLDLNNDKANTPQTDDYQFLFSARQWQDTEDYEREARGNGNNWDDSWNGPWSGWGSMSWSTGGPNNNDGGIDFGWTAGFYIPWETLGLVGPPEEDTLWGLGVQLYDRDDNPPAGTVAPQYWPETFQSSNPATWGEIHFGNVDYTPLANIPTGEAMIRATSSTDNTVEDAWMGGGGWCMGGHEGGSEINHGDHENLFTGSEIAATHFPCFNKSFLRFQLDSIPLGKEIISATLTLHLFGNADQTIAPPYSWTHLFSIKDDWDEMTIHWNNAPLAQENISSIQVYPYSQVEIVWPGDPYTWDATKAVAEAYAAGKPVDLALYSSDAGRDTSKYYSSSETGDWNEEARPTLQVTWGNPNPSIDKVGSQAIALRGDEITYTITWQGTGVAQTMVDQIPVGFSAPRNIQANIGSASYHTTNGQILWSGTPTQGETVTLTYQIAVQTDGPTILTNISDLSDSAGIVSSDHFNLFINPLQTYLPLISH